MEVLKKVKRIVVPVTLDQAGENILKFAGALAKVFEAELLLLYATQSTELTFTQQSRYIHTLRTFGERVLLRQHESGTGFVRFDCLVRPGTLRKCIKAVVQDHYADLVVMEISPLQANADFTPDHASAILEHISCPVMLVPPHTVFQNPDHLVFATDFTDRDENILRKIGAFASQANAKLTMVQVYNDIQQNQYIQMMAGMREVERLVGEQVSQIRLLNEEDVLEGISDFAEQEDASMLVLATQDSYLTQRLFSNAYTKTLAYHTRIPLLLYRQLKRKPCSGCCTTCMNKVSTTAQLQTIPVSQQ